MAKVARPTENENVYYHATAKIAKDVVRWEGKNPDDEDEFEETRQSLVKAMEYAFPHGDGYVVAKRLDQDGWDGIDDELVELLSGLDHAVYEVMEETVAGWVSLYDVKPVFKVGDKVLVRERRKSENVIGEIIKIDDKHAKYTIFVEALGHVREGIGTHGIVLPFESVETKENGVEGVWL